MTDRRDQILEHTLREQSALWARRRRRGRTVAVASLLAVASGLWLVTLAPPRTIPSPAPVALGTPPRDPSTSHAPAPLVQLVGNTPGVLDRMRVDPVGSVQIIRGGEPTLLVEIIDDDQLTTLLAQIGRPAGIIRTQGRVYLSRAVTDEELGLRKPGA